MKTATRKREQISRNMCSGLVGALSGPLCRFVWSNGVQAGLWSIAECSGSAHGVCVVCVCGVYCTLVSAAATADVFFCWNRAEVCITLNKLPRRALDYLLKEHESLGGQISVLKLTSVCVFAILKNTQQFNTTMHF